MSVEPLKAIFHESNHVRCSQLLLFRPAQDFGAYQHLSGFGSQIRFSGFLNDLFVPAMLCRMTFIAECDQVVFLVRTRVAAKLLVVDFEVGHRSTELTAPAVSP